MVSGKIMIFMLILLSLYGIWFYGFVSTRLSQSRPISDKHSESFSMHAALTQDLDKIVSKYQECVYKGILDKSSCKKHVKNFEMLKDLFGDGLTNGLIKNAKELESNQKLVEKSQRPLYRIAMENIWLQKTLNYIYSPDSVDPIQKVVLITDFGLFNTV